MPTSPLKAIVKMLDGTEEHIEVVPVERDGFKYAAPLTVDSRWGLLRYLGKGQDSYSLYVQERVPCASTV